MYQLLPTTTYCVNCSFNVLTSLVYPTYKNEYLNHNKSISTHEKKNLIHEI